MALAVDLSSVTASDGTFSAAGAAAWLTVKDRTATLTGIASAAQGGTGNATGTATINADLTGIVTSVGNATSIADKAISYTKLADGTDGNLITWDASGVAALVATGNATQVLTSNGAGTAPTFQDSAAGGATLNGITAATADQAGIANADWNVRWNWFKQTDSEVSFELGETTAATNGTSTSGVPNQVLAKFSTLAASTMSPLSVYSRATHVFSVSPTTAQILSNSGTVAAPIFSFTADPDTGIYRSGNGLINFACDGANFVRFNDATPNIQVTSSSTNYSSTSLGYIQFESAASAVASLALVRGVASAVGIEVNAYKSRGTALSPTVITTGDDLLTLSGFGYVGATGTYVEACRITYDSTGTIANTTSGLGGIMRLACAVVGTVGPVEIAQVNGTEQHLLHVGTVPSITAGGGAGPSPTIAGTDEAFTVTVGGGGIATSVEVTFAKAFTVAPRCTANHQGAVLILRCVSLVNKVTIDAATPFTTSGLIDVICRSGTT